MRDYPWIYVPVLNFFGAIIVIIEGVVKHSLSVVVVGVILSLICIVGILGILFEKRLR